MLKINTDKKCVEWNDNGYDEKLFEIKCLFEIMSENTDEINFDLLLKNAIYFYDKNAENFLYDKDKD